jgi:hemoglobin-like flavoprotein
VGDDSDIIKQEGGGAVFNVDKPESIAQGIARMAALIREPDYRTAVRQLAVKHRSLELSRQAYHKFFA